MFRLDAICFDTFCIELNPFKIQGSKYYSNEYKN